MRQIAIITGAALALFATSFTSSTEAQLPNILLQQTERDIAATYEQFGFGPPWTIDSPLAPCSVVEPVTVHVRGIRDGMIATMELPMERCIMRADPDSQVFRLWLDHHAERDGFVLTQPRNPGGDP